MLNKKIHIVHIIPTLAFGGAERFVIDLINNLDSDKFVSSLIILKNHLPLATELKVNCSIYLVEKKGQVSWGLFKALENKLKEIKPDVVHTNLFGADLWGRVAAHKLNLPIVTTEHSLKISESFIKTFIKKCLRNYTNVYTAPSAIIAKHLAGIYKITKPIKTIYHGLDLTRFKNLTALKITEPIQLLILGRLATEKGHSLALQALANLKQFSWQLKIVGDGPEKSRLEKLISKLNLEKQVEILAPTAKVPEILANTQVILMPSLNEGLGIVAMEAMSAGRLVIGAKVGGIPEIINHEKTGLLAEAGNVSDWVNKLTWVFTNHEEVAKIAKNGKDYALKNFGIEKMVAQYETIYEDLIHHS